MEPEDREALRMKLCGLQVAIQKRVLEQRDASEDPAELAEVVSVTAADTIYRIDRIGEEAVLDWLDERWPEEWPAELVMEGLDERIVFPRRGHGAGREPRLTCIIDPLDGTRCLMHDKRSAWVLAALAPFGDGTARLSDVQVAAMTEVPPSKQRLVDQVSGVRGGGRRGVRALRLDLDSRRAHALRLRPSSAVDLVHGFAALSRFFPDEKELVARIEVRMLERLYAEHEGWQRGALVFEDQYISTGGQFYELMAGHDRMLGDLRPLVFAALGRESAITCHPYDACTALLLEELGCVLEKPEGGPLDAPLDLTSPVAWVGYANTALAEHVRPALSAAIEEVLGA